MNGSPFAAAAATVAVDPSGRFLYAAGFNVNNLSAFTINPLSGSLTPVLGSPFTAGVGMNPFGIVVDPSGQFLYVGNTFGSGTISAFSIDAVTGAPAPVTGSPFATGIDPRSVCVDPSGKFLFAGTFGDGKVSGYAIGASGGLTPVSGSPFAVGAGILGVVVDPSAKFLYVADNSPGSVRALSLGAGGALTQISGSPFAAGMGTEAVVVTAKTQ
jgi:6-phosphogluconolactonase (cycloisomerase 2 family)